MQLVTESFERGAQMPKMISVCGVLCSNCPAYLGDAKGVAHKTCTAEAWRRIYGLNESIENISCGGCLGPDEKLFHTSRACEARRCCRSNGFSSCAECSVESCLSLEKAQSIWDEVPALGRALSLDDFVRYAQPYIDHRRRLAEVRLRLLQGPG